MSTQDEGDDDTAFGLAARSRRAQLGLTLEQLAETSGVSAAALSRVERGLLGPSLRNAQAIARALGCSLGELVGEQGATITRQGENLRYTDPATGIERIALARPTAEAELLRYLVPPGATSSRFAAHKPGTREIFHLLAGHLQVHTAQETITLASGDTAVLRVDSEHWFHNPGTKAAQIILLILGH